MNIDLTNMNPVSIAIFIAVVFLIIGGAIYALLTISRKGKNISKRVDQFVLTEAMKDETTLVRSIIPREIYGSLFKRTFGNWFSKFIEFIGKYTPEKQLVNLEHKLVIAGNPGNLHAGAFYGIRFIMLLVGVSLAFFMNRDFKNINMTSMLVGILFIVLFLVLPTLWLTSNMRRRQEDIQRGLPDALDMLSVCASAGLGFDQSMQKISSYWETELGNEFKRVIQEMKMGIPRSEALKNMSERLEVSDLTQFIVIIIQAEKIGMSYADVLHSQSIQLRVLRQLRAREIANKLPGKMMIPVVLFIFPAIMAVILGPTIPLLFNIF